MQHNPTYMLPILCAIGLGLFILENLIPAHPQKAKAEWYVRATLVAAFQLLVFALVESVWGRFFNGTSVLNLDGKVDGVLGAMLAYFIFTFVVYWWHRLRHKSDFLWRWFHQFHHSPQRIQVLTAYYMHPFDMMVSLTISNLILFFFLGVSGEAAAWYTLITGVAGFIIHSNLNLPRFVGYIFQTPAMHRLHHKQGAHRKNYSDITWWDMIFGTYENPEVDLGDCGFRDDLEKKWLSLLLGKKYPTNLY
ncbi:MAG: sterol desaturase family protein [Gammaproteobacteria bacterium]|nr:sterol desaturase family protein [Gammaproteobacteria bacterium]